MYKIAKASEDERRALFHNTATRMRLSDAIIEKDFWVCWTLDYLFRQSAWQQSFAFKGGTSLSKCYGLIKRFSEDIDLILDWRQIGYSADEPWVQRSVTQQDRFCEEMNRRTAEFLSEQFVPALRKDFTELLHDSYDVSIDETDSQTVCFNYPRCFQPSYVQSTLRLEIGALAAWTPATTHEIKPFAAEEYARLFEKPTTSILTVSAERTFWEKATILHKEAFRHNGNLPGRYSRHYYDLYCMAHSPVAEAAFSDLNLLKHVVEFKTCFYHSNSAHYDLASPGTMKLLPPDNCLAALEDDYRQMADMIFSDRPSFAEIMAAIQQLETKINSL